jgi:hypothetical protein
VGGIGLGPSQTPPSTPDSGGDPSAKGLGAHPDDETSIGFSNVTHLGSLRFRVVPMIRAVEGL